MEIVSRVRQPNVMRCKMKMLNAILGGFIGGIIGGTVAIKAMNIRMADEMEVQNISYPPNTAKQDKDEVRFLSGLLCNLCDLFRDDYLEESSPTRSQLSQIYNCIGNYVDQKHAAEVLSLHESNAVLREFAAPVMEAAMKDERTKAILQKWINGCNIAEAPDEELKLLLDVFYENLPDKVVESIKKYCRLTEK